MNIQLDVMMYIAGGRSLHGGSFPVIIVDFKKDPDWTASVIAYQFIQDIKFKTGYHDDTKVLNVIYNGENDITELVKKVRPNIQDNLPF